MIIGLDFDNTIVSYDSLFHKVSVEQNLINEIFEVNKIKIRDYLPPFSILAFNSARISLLSPKVDV